MQTSLTDQLSVTTSTLTAFQLCPRKYYLNQVKGYVPKQMGGKVSKLLIGRLFHEAQEFRTGDCLDAAINLIDQRIREMANEHIYDEPDLAKTRAMLYGMVQGLPWQDHIDKCSTHKEVVLSGTVSGVPLMGKLDLLVKDPDTEKLWITDYKTVGELPKDVEDVYEHDPQVLIYRKLVTGNGVKFDGVQGFRFYYVRRPALRCGKKESWAGYCNRICKDYKDRPEMYYRQMDIPFKDTDKPLEFLTGDDWKSIKATVADIQHCLVDDYFCQNRKSCMFYKVRCSFLPICNEEDGCYYLYDKREPFAHPELAEDERGK